jgi:hypothetical protein
MDPTRSHFPSLVMEPPDGGRRLRASRRSALVGGGEMRQLISASLPERGAVGHPGHVGIGRGSITGRADFRDAEDICHQQIRGGEATSCQPIPRDQNVLELVQAGPSGTQS